MDAYRTSLLVVHVLSAVIGIGATFTFGVLGSLQGRIQGPGAAALLEAADAIEKRIVNPFALGLLPLTGVLMVFARGWSVDFWSHTWLVGAIVLYIIAAGVSTGVAAPGTRKLLTLTNEGKAGSPEFLKLVKTQQRVGPFLNLVAVAIVVLMVWKPGG